MSYMHKWNIYVDMHMLVYVNLVCNYLFVLNNSLFSIQVSQMLSEFGTVSMMWPIDWWEWLTALTFVSKLKINRWFSVVK